MHHHHGIAERPRLARGIAIAICLLLLGWLLVRRDAFLADQNGLIRFALSVLFSALILFRPKPETPARGLPWWGATALVGLGTFTTILGLILPIRQLEWLGLECMAAGALCWVLPHRAHRDVWRAAFILYWAVPLPDALFIGLQEIMQALSVKGSEAFLQMVNVRAWAYETAIHTPSATYHVPGWCSGMRAATTVLLLTIGMGMLRHLRLRSCALFAIAAEGQVLLLNILRISLMVILVPAFNAEQAEPFLHRTTGLLVLAAVVLVAAELAVLVQWRERHLHSRSELDDHRMRHVTEHPPFWRELSHKRPILITLLAATIITLIVVNRAQRYHRAGMLKDVATGQRDLGNLDVAMAAATRVLRITPDDLTWRFTAMRMKLLRGDHASLIKDLDSLSPEEGADSTQANVLRAYALMSLGDMDAAARIVDTLPDATKQSDPRAAMVLAELSMRAGRPDQTASYALTASRWTPNTGRIRNLYPYLRVHRKWDALIGTDTGQSFTDPIQACSLLEALMNLNHSASVARHTRIFLEQWPTDPRLLEPLFFLAIQDPSALLWREHFSEHLRRSLPAITSPERLYELIYKCVELHRPDLTWAVAAQLQTLDPDSPALPMAAAVYGNAWFRYDRRHLGHPSLTERSWRDVSELALLAHMFPAWLPTLRTIPFADSLSHPDEDPNRLDRRQAFLQEAITTFQRHQANTNSPPLSLDMHYLFVQALERDGRLDLAESELKKIATTHPLEEPATRTLLSAIYERAGRWVDVYETLHDYLDRPSDPLSRHDTEALAQAWTPFLPDGTIHRQLHLTPMIRLGRAQLTLNLGLAAHHTATTTVERYPYAPQAYALMGRTLLNHGTPAEALSSITAPQFHHYQELDYLEAEALFQTQRYTALQDIASTRALPYVRIPPDAPQYITLPPAEVTLLWHHFHTPDEAEYARHAATIQSNQTTAASSPWLSALFTRWLQAWQTQCAPQSVNPDDWERIGRTPAERATALHQLALLLCRARRIPEASSAINRALTHLPDDPTLWLTAISLNRGAIPLIAEARANCPDDANLWLAELVATTAPPNDSPRSPDPLPAHITDWVDHSVQTAIQANMPVEFLARAADYLLRHNLPDPAIILMRHAEPQARGHLPSLIVAIRCALQANDSTWAIRVTERAISNSQYPLPPLFKQLIALKTAHGELKPDTATIHALLSLKQIEPDTTLWPQMLGYIRFQDGGWDIIDALFSMTAALDQGATNRLPFVIAAEAARRLNDVDKSLDLLREALTHHPADPILVNNLAFTLAHDKQYIAEATALLPALAPLADTRDDVLDTMAYILLRANRPADASELAAQLAYRSPPGSRYWIRANRYLAEATWKQGDTTRATRMLTNLLEGQKSMNEEDLRETTELLARMLDSQQPAPPQPNPLPDMIPAPPPLSLPDLPTPEPTPEAQP